MVTDGLMISVTADLIMFLQQIRMSMYSSSIQKFILTQADRLLSLLTFGAIAQFAAAGKDVKKKDLSSRLL